MSAVKPYTEFSTEYLQVLSLNVCLITFTPKRKGWNWLGRITLNSTATYVDMTLNLTQMGGGDKNVQTGTKIKNVKVT